MGDRGPVDAWRWRGDGAGQCAAFQAGPSRPPPEFACLGLADSQWDCPDLDSPSDWLKVGPIARETSTQGTIIGFKIQLLWMTTFTGHLHGVERVRQGKWGRLIDQPPILSTQVYYHGVIDKIMFRKEIHVLLLEDLGIKSTARGDGSLVHRLPSHRRRRIFLAVKTGNPHSPALETQSLVSPGISSSRISLQSLRWNPAHRARIHSICEPRDSVGSLVVTRNITLHIEQTFPFRGKFALQDHSSLNSPAGAWKDACTERPRKPVWEQPWHACRKDARSRARV